MLGRRMGRTLSRQKKMRDQLLSHALFGKSSVIRMQALLLLTQNEIIEGGWLLETALKYENLSVKN
jgi:hypothetical protein